MLETTSATYRRDTLPECPCSWCFMATSEMVVRPKNGEPTHWSIHPRRWARCFSIESRAHLLKWLGAVEIASLQHHVVEEGATWFRRGLQSSVVHAKAQLPC